MQTTTCLGCDRALTQMGLSLYHSDDGTPGCVDPCSGKVLAEMAPTSETIVCDLCSSMGPWTRDIIIKPITTEFLSVDLDTDASECLTIIQSPDWAVCTQCETDLMARNFDAIDQRAVVNIQEQNPHLRLGAEEILAEVADLHATVWQTWDGTIHDHQ